MSSEYYQATNLFAGLSEPTGMKRKGFPIEDCQIERRHPRPTARSYYEGPSDQEKLRNERSGTLQDLQTAMGMGDIAFVEFKVSTSLLSIRCDG